MDKSMIAYCGTYCGVCEWKDEVGCKGCKACSGEMFWGECDKAKCCIAKGLEHCGQCTEMPCDKLKLLFGDPEHGDKGVRLRNLQNWNNGNYTFDMVGHWTGIFNGKGSKTEIDFTEDVTAKKLIMKPFVKGYLKRQQEQYVSDLRKALNFTIIAMKAPEGTK